MLPVSPTLSAADRGCLSVDCVHTGCMALCILLLIFVMIAGSLDLVADFFSYKACKRAPLCRPSGLTPHRACKSAVRFVE